MRFEIGCRWAWIVAIALLAAGAPQADVDPRKKLSVNSLLPPPDSECGPVPLGVTQIELTSRALRVVVVNLDLGRDIGASLFLRVRIGTEEYSWFEPFRVDAGSVVEILVTSTVNVAFGEYKLCRPVEPLTEGPDPITFTATQQGNGGS